MQRAQQPSIKTHFGKNQGGAARLASTVRAVRDRLRLASTIAGVQQAGEELARASLSMEAKRQEQSGIAPTLLYHPMH